MTDEIKQRIRQYIDLIKGILDRIQSAKTQTDNVGTYVVKDLLTQVGGEFAAELLGSKFVGLGKKATRKYLETQQKQQQQAAIGTYAGQFEYRLSEIKNFLSNVSIRKRNLTKDGSSHLLLKKFASLNNYTKLETKILRAITILESISNEPLIFNKDIPEPEVESRHAYDMLKNLESKLRNFIEKSLSGVSANWWKERIPDDVRERAEERKRKNEQTFPWHTGRDLHPIHYVDFADYAKIIRRRDSWREVYKDVFKDEELIATKLKELEPIRNAIAHSRDLTHGEFERLKVNSNDIMKSIRVYG